ncbi:helix-turn-helix domain-containing protein [Anaerococcus sp. AGMB09787]|uniref:helix-turn-helix domain-containing protein n=1 Tax=Anaerococcus sp. AGMB09787 TaxID=2922869 RepID=UPI001FAEDF6C|nr:helix-turn-helix domain-containing protein [Anaerococcus sp. AGMB09787]
MSYKNLTINDRYKIEVLKKEGYSSRIIAKILELHHSTISRELKRSNNTFSAIEASKDRET